MLIISSIISSIVLFNNQSLAQLKLDKFDGDILSDLTSLPPGSSPILRPNQAGRKIDWRKILTSQFQEFTFKLPPPPPGKPVSGRIRGGGRRGSSYCPNTETSLTDLVPAIRKTINVGQTNFVENNVWGLTTSERTTFYFYIPFSKSTKTTMMVGICSFCHHGDNVWKMHQLLYVSISNPANEQATYDELEAPTFSREFHGCFVRSDGVEI